MSEPSPAAVLAALGEPITLADGSTVRLRYSFRAIAMLEERFGSLPAVTETLRSTYDALDDPDRSDAKVFSALLDCLAPGLIDVRVQHPDTGQTIRLGSDHDLVADLLDPRQLTAYTQAFGKAIRESFGQLYGRRVGEEPDPQTTQPNGASAGTSTITSPSSSPAEAISGSGA